MRRLVAAVLTCAAVLATSVAVESPAHASTGVILDADSPAAIAGSYIVAVQPSAISGSTTLTSIAQSLTTTYGGTVGDVDTAFDMFGLTGTDAIAEQIAGDSRVVNVDQDETVTAAAVQTDPPWGLDRIDQRPPALDQTYNYTTGNATVYVVDSGIRTTNTDFGGRAHAGFNALTNTVGSAPDCPVASHGTMVAGIIAGQQYGVDKTANVIGVKVLGCGSDGKDTSSSANTQIFGLNWIANSNTAPAIVNMSIRTYENDNMAQAIRDLQLKNYTVVVSAGNSFADACTTVAGILNPEGGSQTLITVGATDNTDAMWSKSAGGRCVTLFAPGVDIPSDGAGTDTEVQSGSGTSFAAPHVAGAAALILAANPHDTPAQIMSLLVANATSPATNGGAEVISGRTEDSPDLLLYVPPPTVATAGGPAVTGTVTPTSDGYNISFAGTAGQTIYVNGTTGGFNTRLTLLDPTGAQIATGNGSFLYANSPRNVISPVVLHLNGTYTLQDVADPGSSGTISLQVFNSYLTATAPTDGSLVSVTIPTSSPGQRAAFTFTGLAGQSVYVNGTTGAYNTAFTLDDPSGNQVATGSGSSISPGSPQQAINTTLLNVSGTYTVYATPDASATGTIGVQVFGSYLTAVATVDGPLVSVTIPSTSPGQKAAFTFTGTAGQTVYINETTGSINTHLTLDDPQGIQVATGVGDVLSPFLPQVTIAPVLLHLSGTYTLYVVPDSNVTGSIGIQVFGSYVTTSAGVNGLPKQLTIPLSKPGQRMKVTFTGGPGQTITVMGITGLINVGTTLLDPNGRQVATGSGVAGFTCEDDEAPGTCPQPIVGPVLLQLAGTYTLMINPDAYASGTITVEVISTATPPSGPPVGQVNTAVSVDGAAASVTIPSSSPGASASFTFAGTAGETVYVNGKVTSAPFTSDSLIDPSGNTLAVKSLSPTSSAQQLFTPVTLTTTGTYTLYFDSPSSATGTISVQVFSQVLTAPATVNGTAATVTVPTTSPGQRAAITFSGTAGETVYANVIGTSAGQTGYTVTDPSGNVLVPMGAYTGYDWSNLISPLTLPSSGTYSINFIPDASATGTISLHLYSQYLTAAATVDGPVASVTVPATSQGQRVAFTFTGNAGQNVYANVIGNQAGITDFTVTDPSGKIIIPVTYYAAEGDVSLFTPFTLPSTGTYTINIFPTPGNTGLVGVQVFSQILTASTTIDAPAATVIIPSGYSGQRAAISLYLGTNETVTINSTGFETGYTNYTLIDPSGHVVLPPTPYLNYTTTVVTPMTLAAPGTYKLIIVPDPKATGTATVSILDTPVNVA